MKDAHNFELREYSGGVSGFGTLLQLTISIKAPRFWGDGRLF